MARLPALALVRPRPLWARVPAVPVPLPSARSAALAFVVLALGGSLYAAARQTSVFAVKTIAVTGAPSEVAREVTAVARSVRGESLVALDPEALLRRIDALPSVVSARLDRAFPNTLEIVVRPERPVAVVRAGTTAWLVSAGARIVRPLDRARLPDLPRVWLPSATPLAAGRILDLDEQAGAVRALARVPEAMPGTIVTAREVDGQVTFVLGSGTEIRLGDGSALPLKLRVATAILGRLSAGERASLRYLDVSLPERPVAGI